MKLSSVKDCFSVPLMNPPDSNHLEGKYKVQLVMVMVTVIANHVSKGFTRRGIGIISSRTSMNHLFLFLSSLQLDRVSE